MASWQLQEAKTHLSEVIEEACTSGPQVITRHGRERAVVLSIEDYQGIAKLLEDKPNAVDVLLGPPFLHEDDDFFTIMDEIQADRKRHLPREVDL